MADLDTEWSWVEREAVLVDLLQVVVGVGHVQVEPAHEVGHEEEDDGAAELLAYTAATSNLNSKGYSVLLMLGV